MSIAEKLTTIAENEQKVYNAGIAQGREEQNTLFWNTFQNGGSRWNYDYAFYRNNFSDETFRPVHDIGGIFFNYAFSLSPITNLKALLKECGVTLNTSGANFVSHMFYASEITHLPIIDLSSATDTTYTLSVYSLVEIEKLIVAANTPYSDTFMNVNNLQKMIVEGTIGKSGFDVITAKSLSKESITSIINALSSTTSGLNVSISKTAVNNAFETSTGAADGSTSTEWTTLIASKSNWTISLIN